jgi:hypothetical protein
MINYHHSGKGTRKENKKQIVLKKKKLPFWGSFPLSTKTLKPINYE